MANLWICEMTTHSKTSCYKAETLTLTLANEIDSLVIPGQENGKLFSASVLLYILDIINYL